MTPPKRQLGLGVAAAIVVANMIGTGVFTSTGFQAHDLHDPTVILIAWIVGGVLALCGAATYAELGSLMPEAGGEYVYLRKAYHPVMGFMSGWVSITAGFSVPIAVSALAFSGYFGSLVGLPKDPWLVVGFWDIHVTIGAAQLVGIALIGLVALLHSFDAKIGGRVQAAFTAAKVLLIVAFIIGGFTAGTGSWDNFKTTHGSMDNLTTPEFARALMYVSFAYSGWNAAAYIAGEIKRPEWTLPRALLVGTGVVMVLYVLLNVIFFYAVPSDTLAGPFCDANTCVGGAGPCPDKCGFGPVIEVGAQAATNMFGTVFGSLLTALIALALVSAVSAMVMAGPRVYSAMAKDGALPGSLAQHNERGVPLTAVITQAILAMAFVLMGDLGQLILFASFSLTIFAALTVSSVFIFRARGMRSQYRTFGYPVTPVLFLALSVWICYLQVTDHPAQSAAVLVLLAIGGVVYAVTQPKQPSIPRATLQQ